jgi:undecaprenyl-diphosphatase
MRGLDQAVFRAINTWPEALRPFMHFFSEGIKTSGLRIAILAYLLTMISANAKTRKAALLALLAWPLANGFTEALKTGFPMLRPSVELSDAIIRGSNLTSFGTASSHSANMAAVAFVFTYQLGWWGSPWILIALFTGLSRIYMGVHYPSQVLLGWITGAFCGLLIVKTWEAFVFQRGRSKHRSEQHATPTEA